MNRPSSLDDPDSRPKQVSGKFSAQWTSDLQLQNAVETALVSLESHKWVSLQAPASRRQKLTSQASGDQGPKVTSGSPAKGEGGPPYELMDHPPLAVLTNGLLGALNELRHCSPLSLSQRLATVLKVGALRCYRVCIMGRLHTFEQPVIAKAIKTSL